MPPKRREIKPVNQVIEVILKKYFPADKNLIELMKQNGPDSECVHTIETDQTTELNFVRKMHDAMVEINGQRSRYRQPKSDLDAIDTIIKHLHYHRSHIIIKLVTENFKAQAPDFEMLKACFQAWNNKDDLSASAENPNPEIRESICAFNLILLSRIAIGICDTTPRSLRSLLGRLQGIMRQELVYSEIQTFCSQLAEKIKTALGDGTTINVVEIGVSIHAVIEQLVYIEPGEENAMDDALVDDITLLLQKVSVQKHALLEEIQKGKSSHHDTLWLQLELSMQSLAFVSKELSSTYQHVKSMIDQEVLGFYQLKQQLRYVNYQEVLHAVRYGDDRVSELAAADVAQALLLQEEKEKALPDSKKRTKRVSRKEPDVEPSAAEDADKDDEEETTSTENLSPQENITAVYEAFLKSRMAGRYEESLDLADQLVVLDRQNAMFSEKGLKEAVIGKMLCDYYVHPITKKILGIKKEYEQKKYFSQLDPRKLSIKPEEINAFRQNIADSLNLLKRTGLWDNPETINFRNLVGAVFKFNEAVKFYLRQQPRRPSAAYYTYHSQGEVITDKELIKCAAPLSDHFSAPDAQSSVKSVLRLTRSFLGFMAVGPTPKNEESPTGSSASGSGLFGRPGVIVRKTFVEVDETVGDLPPPSILSRSRSVGA